MKKKLLFGCIFILSLNYILYCTLDLNEIYKYILRIIAFLLLIFGMILPNKERLTLNLIDFVWVMLISLSLFSFGVNGNVMNLIFILLVIISSKKITTNDFINSSYYIVIIGLVIITSFLYLGVIESIQYTVGNRIRTTFGFNNVNAFSAFMYSFSMLFLLSKKRIKFIHLGLIAILTFVLYLYTDSRTATYAIFIFLISYLLLVLLFKIKQTKKYGIFLKSTLTFIILVPLIFSILSPFILAQFPSIDVITSLRLSVFTQYISNNNFINILLGGSKFTDIDNAFLTLMYSVGTLFIALTMYLIVKATIILINNKESKYIAFIISFMYLSAFEAWLLRPEIIISLSFWVLVYKSVIDNYVP